MNYVGAQTFIVFHPVIVRDQNPETANWFAGVLLAASGNIKTARPSRHLSVAQRRQIINAAFTRLISKHSLLS